MELLLAGTPSPLLSALASRSQATRVLTATEQSGTDEEAEVVPWNRRSPIAARTLVLHALSTLEKLDHAMLLYSVTRVQAPFHEQSATSFEKRIDEDLKGYLFLARELLIHFSKAGSGTLDFVLVDPADQTIDPLADASIGAFRSMVQSLFVLYQNEPFMIRGFSAETDRLDEFSIFVWDTIRDKGEKVSGRWSKFGSRGGLFSFGRG